MSFQTMTVQLEYINHMLQFFENISYYAGIMLNAFCHLYNYYAQNYISIVGWPLDLVTHVYICTNTEKYN